MDSHLKGFAIAGSGAAPFATVAFTDAAGSQQGLATDGADVWISLDVGAGLATISTYSLSGRLVGVSAPLRVGHGAELDYRVRDKRLSVANGGLTSESSSADATVYAVALGPDRVATRVVRTYDFGWLGRNGLVAIANQIDEMAVIGGPDDGPWRIAITPFPVAARTTAAEMRAVVLVRDPHVLLQGLGATGGLVYLSVSDRISGGSRLDTFTRSGLRTEAQPMPFAGEAEGLAINPSSGQMLAGTHDPDRVLRVNPGSWAAPR